MRFRNLTPSAFLRVCAVNTELALLFGSAPLFHIAMKLEYVLKRVVRRQIPAPLFFRMMTYSGSGNLAEDDPEEMFRALHERLQVLAIDLTGKQVLEIGSGRYARLGLRMLHAGASRVTLADLHATPLNNRQHRAMLEEDCDLLGLDLADALSRIHLVTDDYLAVSPPSPELRADLVTSTATMEHVRNPREILAKSWEWLRPGGVSSHAIDLRDHCFETPFEMLTYSDRVWERWLVPKGGFHLNRWRLPDYLQAMRDAGFIDVRYEILEKSEDELGKVRDRLDERFRAIDDDLLSVMKTHVYGQKPSS